MPLGQTHQESNLAVLSTSSTTFFEARQARHFMKHAKHVSTLSTQARKVHQAREHVKHAKHIKHESTPFSRLFISKLLNNPLASCSLINLDFLLPQATKFDESIILSFFVF